MKGTGKFRWQEKTRDENNNKRGKRKWQKFYAKISRSYHLAKTFDCSFMQQAKRETEMPEEQRREGRVGVAGGERGRSFAMRNGRH